MSTPLEIRDQLGALLQAAEREPGLLAELERAKREYFGPYLDWASADADREQRAIRFTEWFLCERPSDVLGAVPVNVAEAHFGTEVGSDLLRESLAGVFLVQSTADGTTVRDLEGGRSLELRQVPNRLEVGDVLIGRLFESSDGSGAFVPSAAMAIVSGSPQFAVAFRRDVKNLGLDRRLTQVELEHLLFETAKRGDEQPAVPLERLEAELDTLLVAAGKADVYTAFQVSDALRASDRPLAVIEALLDEMAFDTDADLDRLRRLLLELAGAAQAGGAGADDDAETDEVEVKLRPPRRPTPFEARDGEPLGARLARRIEEGLAGEEQIEELFADVERMFGEQIDEEEDRAGELLEDGDLEPLVREFAWEVELDSIERERLDAFVAVQRAAPVPRATLESIDSDDVLRYLLQTWMGAPPDRRVAELRQAFGIVDRFYRWAEDVQGFDRIAELRPARESLVDAAERLDAAAVALSDDPEPRGRAELFSVAAVESDGVVLRVGDTEAEVRIAIRPEHAARILPDDVVLGALDAQRSSFDGMVVVVPGRARHLLG